MSEQGEERNDEGGLLRRLLVHGSLSNESPRAMKVEAGGKEAFRSKRVEGEGFSSPGSSSPSHKAESLLAARKSFSPRQGAEPTWHVREVERRSTPRAPLDWGTREAGHSQGLELAGEFPGPAESKSAPERASQDTIRFVDTTEKRVWRWNAGGNGAQSVGESVQG